jgi:hypothetical protein
LGFATFFPPSPINLGDGMAGWKKAKKIQFSLLAPPKL